MKAKKIIKTLDDVKEHFEGLLNEANAGNETVDRTIDRDTLQAWTNVLDKAMNTLDDFKDLKVQVKALTEENKQLREENAQLSKYASELELENESSDYMDEQELF